MISQDRVWVKFGERQITRVLKSIKGGWECEESWERARGLIGLLASRCSSASVFFFYRPALPPTLEHPGRCGSRLPSPQGMLVPCTSPPSPEAGTSPSVSISPLLFLWSILPVFFKNQLVIKQWSNMCWLILCGICMYISLLVFEIEKWLEHYPNPSRNLQCNVIVHD